MVVGLGLALAEPVAVSPVPRELAVAFVESVVALKQAFALVVSVNVACLYAVQLDVTKLALENVAKIIERSIQLIY